MSNTSSNNTISSNPSSNNPGSSWGTKVKGAWNTFEGAGDSLRGGMMDFADTATGTDRHAHHAETDIGHQKTEEGVAQMRGGHQAISTDGTRTTDTTTAAPPLPARSTDATHTGSPGTTTTTSHTTSTTTDNDRRIAP
ncbi:uncharacterized protein LAESUDRAFT_749928 [Laetiporus sulphureus 93-53]|uniref:CsbD-like domain-containing protein n=1 Tax=Laetiporus sulphureus 93-53 TaxID=1314785 RepID=A0A165ECE6_9APHY|nr:uncharacterized protein LAESUDRAFT_749928 [Laetiporus sulphureus 93-53]KZT06723.1 hypothetical protein LAESUDRAFT_749928 [Laetiporus sulphureus 93-53]